MAPRGASLRLAVESGDDGRRERVRVLGGPIRRGSMPRESAEEARSELMALADILLEASGRALNW
ncbi:hypothetical protein GCM10009849_35540 [Sinomonas flava]|uniref:Uncharacterized protein n=1 Tax=Sinomonas flava TaxID=496857 RepID=A0ABN3C2V8_9MICC